MPKPSRTSKSGKVPPNGNSGANSTSLDGVSIIDLADLKAHPNNARKHTAHGIGTLVNSLQEVGAARSGVIDENFTILAGNGTAEALAQAGIRKVKVIEANGEEWVVVKRTGLTKKQKERLALFDNRTQEFSEWDFDVLTGIARDSPDWLDGLWSDKDVESFTGWATPPGDFASVDENIEVEHVCPKCGYQFSGGKTRPKMEDG
jgi:hypothetical protein